MGAKFVVSHLDEQMGPFEEHELKAKWVKGELLPIDYVFDDVKQDWVLLTEKFAWASGKSEATAPPPLREVTMKKRRPDLGPVKETTGITITGIHPPNTVPPNTVPPNTFTGTSTMIGANTQTAVTSVASPEAAKKAGQQSAAVRLNDGVGEFDLSLAQPGQVELVLQNGQPLVLHNSLKIKVTPAEPFQVEWSIPHQQTVGSDIAIHIRATDRSGHLCSHYEDHFVVRVNGAAGKEFNVHMKNGESILKIQHTKAEVWILSFHYAGGRVLKLPEDKTMEWQPGPAAKLILDGPGEYIAGHPLKVHVKAVDAYGNLAKSFSGTVVLEVKAS
jgi:hypothetical protein